MIHFKAIYNNRASDYDRLVMREDYEGNLLKSLQHICPFDGLEVVELGAGTGRVTRILAPLVAHIHSFDISAHMLSVARDRLRSANNWAIAVADNRALPVASSTADVALEGWSVGHAIGWYPGDWRNEVNAAIEEMYRVTKPGGMVILIETLGTGHEAPKPSDKLAEMFAWLEGEHGFSSTWIRTDYRFESLAEAESLVRFFFGENLAARVVRERRAILPECTGIWWRTV